MRYRRSVSELETHAVRWWPRHISAQNTGAAVLELMQDSHDNFLNILAQCDQNPFQVFDLIRVQNFPANLFVKHLCVLSDYGGEPLQRLGRSFSEIFERSINGHYKMSFSWRGREYEHVFRALPVTGLGNPKLKTDGVQALVNHPLNDLFEDVIMVLLHGANSTVSHEANLTVCEVGSLLGDLHAINDYVRKRYMAVSRITGGATANSLGQILQKDIVSFLSNRLDNSYQVTSNGYVSLEGHESTRGMPFDIVVSRGERSAGIEVSFQVTTNSTIERKAGQAPDRQRLMHDNGHYIAYVIDGAGNFQRRSAVSVICDNSDCTVAYSEAELQVLVNWIGEML